MLTYLELAMMLLGIVHFGLPLSYYFYIRKKLNQPWNLNIDRDYQPKLTVIVPTYNEEGFIEAKLSDIVRQDYPKEKMEIIVVDSASTDATADLAETWKARHLNYNIKLLKETDRMGKARALNLALRHAEGEIVAITDADAFLGQHSLREAVPFFSDLTVAAVTGIIQPDRRENRENENTEGYESIYRGYHNVIRIAESKIHSTPIFNGQLMFFRKDCLLKLGGFSLDVGADDSYTATRIALAGCRAIAVPEAVVYEPMPKSMQSYTTMKARRALHLVQTFRKILNKRSEAPRRYKSVLAVETFFHLINPWLLLACGAIFSLSLVVDGLTLLKLAAAIMILGIILVRRVRESLFTWIANQLILAYSILRSFRSRELRWKKIAK